MVDPVGGRFGLHAEFTDGLVVLMVRGELDLFTAPELGALLDAVIDRGHARMVLDLAECDFIDASGLRVIADGVSRAELWGGELTIRSSSGIVRRLLALAAVDEASQDRSAPVSLDVPGASDRRRDARRPRYREAQQLKRAGLVSAGDDVVDDALRLVVALARAAVGGADGVSVSLRRHGRLATVAATDQTISDMDANQYATGEGPCVDASIAGQRFHAEALAVETRWPAFTPRAQALGINAILSSPLLATERPVGALNIYSRTPAAFAPKDQELASIFAAEASIILSRAEEAMTADQLAARLDDGLRTRHLIALAQGVVMERDRVDEDGAYTILRRSSARTGRPLRERADEVVASTRRPRSDDGPRTASDHNG